ncbi:hypothetical protein ABW365_02635 [Enterococcus avium]
MYILEPTSRERIWGTARLHEYHGDHKIEKIGPFIQQVGLLILIVT